MIRWCPAPRCGVELHAEHERCLEHGDRAAFVRLNEMAKKLMEAK